MNYLSLNPYHTCGLKRSIMVAAFLLSTIASFSQTMFEKSYTNFSRIRKFVITADGGSIIAGQSSYLGNADMAMMKLDANGNVEWSHAYGNGSDIDMAESVAPTLDGGYILVGSSAQDCYVVKTNSVGVLQWQKTHTPTESKVSYDVVQLPDSSYVIATGSLASSTYATNAGYMRLDKSGNVIWSKAYSNQAFSCCTYNPNIYKILKLRNSSSLFALGSTAVSSSMSGYFAKFNAAGTVLMQKKEQYAVRYYNGVQTSDNNIVLVGRCAGSSSAIFTKIDTTGNLIWNKIFNNSSPLPTPQSVTELSNGNLLIYGYTNSGESIIMETNSLGVVQQSRKFTNFFNTTNFSIEYNVTIAPTTDGAFLIARDNRVKKIPADITQGCASASATFNHVSTASSYFNETLTTFTVYNSPAKTFIDGSVPAVATSVCSSTYCPSVAQPATVTGAQTICQGMSATYSVPAVSGASSYSWYLPGSWAGTSATNSISITAGALSGTLSVQAVNSCTTSLSSTLAVTVNPSAVIPGSISGTTVICAGTSAVYSIAPVSGATSYSWSLPGGWSGTTTTNSISITAGSAGGTIGVSSVNGCGTSVQQTLAVTVNSTPVQPGSISGNTSPCAGSSATYSVLAVADATSYAWNLPSGWTGTSNTNLINVISGSGGGSISVAAVNGCGTSAGQVQALSIGSVPAMPLSITGNTVICPASSNTYSITAVSGATSYSWSLPGGWSGTSTTNSITITAGSSGGTINVASVNGCGTSAPQMQVVTIGSAPAIPTSVSGNMTVCSGSSNSYSVASVSGAGSYAWILPSGWSGTSSTNSISTTAGSSGGNIQVSAVNGCGTSAAQIQSLTVIAPPSLPAAVSGNTMACVGTTNVYSVAAVSGANSYSWILPSGFSGASTSNVIVITAGGAGGVVQVTANNSCGSSGLQSITVIVNALPNIQANSSNVLICKGETATLTANGGNTYTWSTGATTQSVVVNPIVTTTYTVTGTSAPGCINTAVVTQSVSLCTAIEERSFNSIMIYPNPTNGMFVIEGAKGARIIITTIFGQEIRNDQLLSDHSNVDVSNEPNGIYFIQVEGRNVCKLVKN